jgi:hypothetical protein
MRQMQKSEKWLAAGIILQKHGAVAWLWHDAAAGGMLQLLVSMMLQHGAVKCHVGHF